MRPAGHAPPALTSYRWHHQPLAPHHPPRSLPRRPVPAAMGHNPTRSSAPHAHRPHTLIGAAAENPSSERIAAQPAKAATQAGIPGFAIQKRKVIGTLLSTLSTPNSRWSAILRQPAAC